MSPEEYVQSHAQALKPGQGRVKLHLCCLITAWPLASYLLSLRVSLLTRKIGIENLRGSIVRINRNGVVSMVTVSAAPSEVWAVSKFLSHCDPSPILLWLAGGLADHHWSICF